MAATDPTASRALRRPYVAVLLLLLALFLITRFTYLRVPGSDVASSMIATGAQVMDALIGAVLAALGVTFLLVFVFPGREAENEVRVLAAREINDFIRRESGDTREWLVRARTAAYFRGRTLRWLGEASSASNRTVAVRLIAMDPRDEALSQRHLQTRTSSRAEWTAKRLRLEICATLMTCIVVSNRHPRLDISVSLVRSLWLSSLDISSHHAVVAGPHYGHPAIAYTDRSEFYDTFRGEFMTAFDGGEVLHLSRADFGEPSDTETVRTALSRLNLSGVATSEEDLVMILDMMERPERSNEYR